MPPPILTFPYVGGRATAISTPCFGNRNCRQELFIYRVDDWTGGALRAANDEHLRIERFDVETACNIPNLASDAYPPELRRPGDSPGPGGDG